MHRAVAVAHHSLWVNVLRFDRLCATIFLQGSPLFVGSLRLLLEDHSIN